MPSPKSRPSSPNITKQNLYDWTQHGFRNWKLRQDALEFAHSLVENSNAEGAEPQLPLAVKILDHLVHWLLLPDAAAANSLPPGQEDPEAELRRLPHPTSV